MLSRKTLKLLNELEEYLYKNPIKDVKQRNDYIRQFAIDNKVEPRVMISEYYYEEMCDYLEKSYNAKTKKERLNILQKAHELDDTNIDVEVGIIELSIKDNQKRYQALKELLQTSTEYMKADGWFHKDCIGDFWGIIETRPYMRLYFEYMELSKKLGKMEVAANIGEEMLRLCEGDNLGIRYSLMHIYAYLEREKPVLELLKRYKDEYSIQFYLPVSVLYYKIDDEEKSKLYIKKCMEINEDTKTFLKGLTEYQLIEYTQSMSKLGYRIGTMDEFFACLSENEFLYRYNEEYFKWAKQAIKTIKYKKAE